MTRHNNESCKKASDKISQSDKERYSASVRFNKAQKELKDEIDKNVILNESAYIRPKKA